MNPYDDMKAARKLQELLDRSKNGDREAFLKTFKDLRSYGYDSDGATKRMYDGWALQENDFKASINRVAEYVEIFGSHLYPQNPDASVSAQDVPDQWDLSRFNLEAKLLDYCMKKGDLETSARRALNEALIGGRGLLWFGWNSRRNIPYAVFDTVENFGIDPDAKCPEEVNFIWRRRTKPRFEFKKAVGEDALIDISTLKGNSVNSDIIEYYEFYFRVGIHNYCHLDADKIDEYKTEDGETQVEMDDSPKKFILSEGQVVAVTDWEIPFFQIDAWPCRVLDFRLQPEKLWPVSTLGPALPHLKAMNWIYTAYLNRVKRTTHLTYARAKIRGVAMGDKATEDAMGMGDQSDAGVVDVEMPNGMDPDVKKLLQPLMLDAGMPQFELAWNITNRAFEDSTGLNDLMRAGQDSRQIRTAADADMKAKRSMTRVDDMKKQVQVWFDGILYSLAFVARYLMSSEDVGKLFGQEAGKLWGDLGTPEMKMQEDMARMQQANMMMQQAVMQAQSAMMMAPPPMPGMMPPAPPPIPTPEDIETQMGPPAVVTMEDWINSATRQIVAGSMRTVDHDAQVDNLNMFFSALAPVIGPTPGGMTMIADAFVEYARLNRYSAEFQNSAQAYAQTIKQAMMMPPMPAPTPAEPPRGNPSKPTDAPSQGVAPATAGQFQ